MKKNFKKDHEVTGFEINFFFRYLGLPNDNFERNKGSLPDLSHCVLSSSSLGMKCQVEDQASHYYSVRESHIFF